MARFLRRRMLRKKNLTGIYVLEPMTHSQTAGERIRGNLADSKPPPRRSVSQAKPDC
jgi:hypothetical protein